MKRSLMVRLLVALVALALVAAACTGESTSTDVDQDDQATTDDGGGDTDTSDDDADAGGDDADAGDDAGDDDAEPAEETDADDAAPEPIFAEDTSGIPLFAEFQSTFDRSVDPFSSLDEFCQEHPAAEGRTASMDGITEDTIEIGHLRSTLEELAAIGFGVEVGDVAEQFEFLVDALNECTIRGRTVELITAESSPLAPDTVAELTGACLQLTEDNNSVMVLNSTGFQGSAVFCVTEEHETPLITTQGLPAEFYERSQGRLITAFPSQVSALRDLVIQADAAGLLEGRTIGLVAPDTPGIAEEFVTIENTLVELGHEVAVSDVIGCAGGTSCTEGLQDSVAGMRSAGVDAIFPGLNILSLPGYVSEMVTQGYATGDVQFFNSSLNSQNGDLVSSKVRAFGGEAAADLYNNAFLVDSAYTGHASTEGAVVPPFNELCLNTYAAQGGPLHDYFSADDGSAAGMVATICTQLRIMARVLYNAGDNPTPESIAEAIANLGPVDTNGMIPGSVDGQTGIYNVVQETRWTWPCTFGEDRAFDDQNTCVVPTGNYVPSGG